MFKGIIKGFVWLINQLLTSAVDSSTLSNTLQGFNPTMYGHVTSIMEGAVRTVAYTLLSLFALLEFLKITTRTEGMQQGAMSVEMIVRVLVKIVICKMVLDKVDVVMNAIYGTSLYLVNGVRGIVGSGSGNDVLNLDEINISIDSMGIGDQIGSLIICLVVLLVVAIVVLMVQVIVIGRFIELYVMLAISPIPIATICHEEYSSIAKNFLKSFAAVSLQGALILIVMSFYPILINGAFLHTPGDGSVAMSLLVVMGYSFILALAVFSTQKWAKSICNAM